MIKRKKIDVSEERRILSQMIVSTSFLSELKNIAIPNLFKSPFSITVASWIWEYFEYTEQAPYKAIEDIYLKNRHLVSDEEENELIGVFLSQLSSDWETSKVNNVKYSVRNAVEFFKLRSLEKLRDNLNDSIQSKNARHGERIIADYKRVEKHKGYGVDLFKNSEVIKSAFTMDNEILFSYPKKFGMGMGPFKRGDIYAIMGSPKRGKSFYLIYTATHAVRMSLKTVFISLEMNEDPVIRRFWKGFTGQPDNKGAVEIPVFREGGKDGKYEIVMERRNKRGIQLNKIEDYQKKYERAFRGGALRVKTFPSYSATVQDIEDYLTNLEYYEGFVPDVIVIDYADILLASNQRIDYRHQLNSIWQSLRGMAQKREALVVTGSQTGRAGMSNDASEKDVAEDMRKIAAITKLGILNQNELEKQMGVLRFKVGVQREEKSFSKELVILQGFEIGRPYLDCKLIDEVDMDPFIIKKEKKRRK